MKNKAENFLTTRQLARMWHISEATVKRWADAGHLPSNKTLGGHRRFPLAEVLKFQNERDLVGPPEQKTVPRAATQSSAHERASQQETLEKFFEAVTGGDEAAAANLLLKEHLAGTAVAQILDEVVAGTMRRVGDLWHDEVISVADEHLATHTAVHAIEDLRDAVKIESPKAPRAVCCAVENEFHEIPVLCVQVLLESAGWKVLNLGANTPFFALADAVEKHQPQLACISSTINLGLSSNVREYEHFLAKARQHKTRIAIGGEGFRRAEVRQRFPADFYAETFTALLNFAQQETD